MAATTSKSKSYYDIIGALSTFEVSQEVTLTNKELEQLTKEGGNDAEDNESEEEEEEEQESDDDVRAPVHSYLGGRVNVKEAALASYDLGHTLLGGYVPQHQLESLSSVDFAHYFKRTLESKEALQVFDTFLPATSRTYMLPSTQAERDAKLNGTEGAESNDTHSSNTAAAADDAASYERILPDGKIVRKVVICKRCNRKFRGIDRMKQLKKHQCSPK